MLEEADRHEKKIEAHFFKYENGTEPVRDWLLNLSKTDRKAIGSAIGTVEYEWPVGEPLVKKVGLYWEVREKIETGWARVFFIVEEGKMYLLHGVVKKAKQVSQDDLDITRRRLGLLMLELRKKGTDHGRK